MATAEEAALADIMAEALQSYDAANYQTAFKLWTRAAGRGDTDALVAMANMHRQGEGRAKSLSKAAELYKKAAEQGNGVGQLNYGEVLEQGYGVQRDLINAYVWYGMAGLGGNLWARRRQNDLLTTLNPSQTAAALEALKKAQRTFK